MSLLAEVVVEEWLNRQGYFTIRGIRLGNDEIDILAIRVGENGVLERRHFEVQASSRPIGYIGRLPKAVQMETGLTARSAKARTDEQLAVGAKEWVDRKFCQKQKEQLRTLLASGTWTHELVIHRVKEVKEVKMIEARGVKVWRISDILKELDKGKAYLIKSATGADLIELMLIGDPENTFLNKRK